MNIYHTLGPFFYISLLALLASRTFYILGELLIIGGCVCLLRLPNKILQTGCLSKDIYFLTGLEAGGQDQGVGSFGFS